MAFNPSLSTARDRVRLAVGDTGSTPLMPGGETTYDALIAAASSEAAAVTASARALAAYYATQPDSISSSGESLSWRERVSQWNRIGAGGGGVTPGTIATTAGGESIVTPEW